MFLPENLFSDKKPENSAKKGPLKLFEGVVCPFFIWVDVGKHFKINSSLVPLHHCVDTKDWTINPSCPRHFGQTQIFQIPNSPWGESNPLRSIRWASTMSLLCPTMSHGQWPRTYPKPQHEKKTWIQQISSISFHSDNKRTLWKHTL